ncbi:MAG: nucleotidyltransferase domain-containing protein [Nitrospirae bacterium]|nr:nucleotidyltransferase domain-containing protein [Nitrospirota bacterium]MCL5236648.1 nucleotidyltransferase domain-containing protein [Nitrospirota bacterium]
MNVVTEDALIEITKAIVDAVNPMKIILFGSYARGDARPNSDLDFLVVEEEPFSATRSRRKEIGNIYRKLLNYDMPVDILLYSKNEFDKWKDGINHVIARAHREGRIVYERN